MAAGLLPRRPLFVGCSCCQQIRVISSPAPSGYAWTAQTLRPDRLGYDRGL